VLDVGGGEGVHSTWLAGDGYDVHLVDPVPAHVDQARQHAASAPRPFTVAPGDARALDADDASFDAVLLLGPLYHLTDAADRAQALAEARRVVRPGGFVIAAAISRFASLFDGLSRDRWFDPAFRRIVQQDLATGQHRNPTDDPGWFTTAYFHHPDELRQEAEAAALTVRALLGVEGIVHWLRGLGDHWDDPSDRELLLDAARATESEPALAGLSPHLLLVAERR
jgi:2-polyprenyl-3-methyl-5-hydroxy-6-metoxy-1,4-benzoquinol methylase